MQERVRKAGTRLVRKQILITSEQNRRLKERAIEAGLPESEIVRAAIETALEAADAAPTDWRKALDELLLQGGALDALADRVAAHKERQRARGRVRLTRLRSDLADP